MAYNMPTKNNFFSKFFLLITVLFEGTFTSGLCRWFRFAQLAKGKKFRP
jgi:hypothetical protein